MAKQSGLGDNLYISGYDLSGDTLALGDLGGGPAAKEKTGINKSAIERIGLARDGRMGITSAFNPGEEADAAHARYSLLPRDDVLITYCRGTTLGNPAACLNAKQIDYNGNRSDDGDFIFSVEALANQYGLEWGKLLTAGKRTDTTATNGSSVDFGAAGSNGLQAYLHVFAFTGTSVTIKLQQSSDDGDTDAFADLTGGAFASVTGITSERIAVTGNIEQYLRVVTTGTFSNVVFAVVVNVNETEVSF